MPTRIGYGLPSSINDAGTIAFSGGLDGRAIIATGNGGPITVIVDSAGSIKIFSAFPSINSAGTVAFVGGLGDFDSGAYGIYSGNGGLLTTIADLTGPFSAFALFGFTSINAAGGVAFAAGLDAGGGGLFIGDGTYTSEVIGVGDTLFGSTVTSANISQTSLNDLGQLAFSYKLANGTNGTNGIAIATPTPEPSPTLLLALTLGLSLARRTRW